MKLRFEFLMVALCWLLVTFMKTNIELSITLHYSMFCSPLPPRLVFLDIFYVPLAYGLVTVATTLLVFKTVRYLRGQPPAWYL